MTENNRHPIEVIAMHGWAGDARCWEPWKRATQTGSWHWETGERGYGEFAPRSPQWSKETEAGTLRVVLGHSLGPHLLPPETLRDADTIVLLASFATFVPPGPEGRRARAALSGMAASLGEEQRTRTMLTNFVMEVAEPQSSDRLPPGPLDGTLDETNLARLRADLDLLSRCNGLPDEFPSGARVLIVEAEEDRIVEPAARALLRKALPEAEVIALPGVGHALLAGDVIGRVVAWVEAKRAI